MPDGRARTEPHSTGAWPALRPSWPARSPLDRSRRSPRAGGVAATFAPPAEDATALAKQQQNPISSLISVPLQNNFNTGGGLEDRTSFLLNAQPVLPFKLSDRWNVVSRTVLPIVSTPGPEDTRYSGIGDIQLQFYVTPSKGRSITWGAGPVFSLPTATTTGSRPAGRGRVRRAGDAGPGSPALVTNVWTFADAGDTTKTNQLLVQPFVNYNFGKGWALSSVPIITANWEAESGQQWTVPLGLGLMRTTKFSGRPLVVGVHYYYNVVRPDTAPSSQVRFMLVLLYPPKR
jgi:hypothetical protein